VSRTDALPKYLMRRIAVAAAGVHRAAPFGRGRPGAARALEHLGYVQIDTISVIRRAHEHVLLERVPNLSPEHPNELVRRGEAFEYWTHAAAYLPMSDFRHALPRMHRLRAGGRHWANADPRIKRAVLERVRTEGPLRARDFEAPPGHRGGWWSWKPAKAALERLFHEGELMIVAREGFEKSFDLTERVLPAGVDTRMPDPEEHALHLIRRARDALGVFQPRHVTHLRREAGLRVDVARLLAERVEAGELRTAGAGRDRWYLDAAAVARPPRIPGRVRLLSPFDPLVIHRDRLAHLFAFDYQLECYLPRERRRHGYFSLPILAGSRFVGRADCTAERARGVFRIHHLALEPGADPESLAPGMAAAAAPLARQDGCDHLRIDRVSGLPARTGTALARRIEQLGI
jgi:uncharacterized protein YcaQ